MHCPLVANRKQRWSVWKCTISNSASNVASNSCSNFLSTLFAAKSSFIVLVPGGIRWGESWRSRWQPRRPPAAASSSRSRRGCWCDEIVSAVTSFARAAFRFVWRRYAAYPANSDPCRWARTTRCCASSVVVVVASFLRQVLSCCPSCFAAKAGSSLTARTPLNSASKWLSCFRRNDRRMNGMAACATVADFRFLQHHRRLLHLDAGGACQIRQLYQPGRSGSVRWCYDFRNSAKIVRIGNFCKPFFWRKS